MMKQPEIQPRTWKQSFGVLTLLLTIGFSATLHGAQTVTLAWDPSPGPGVVGYKLHYGGTSGTYTSMLDAGNSTNATVSALLVGQTYYFAVCAYNASGLESDPSNEIQYTVPTPGNTPPIANNSSVQGNEDQTAAVLLSASDPDGNPLTFAVVTSPAHGSLSGTAPNLTYSPQANYNGPDSFTFRVNDGTTNSGTATVSLTVTPVNDPPVAANGSATTTEDAAVNVVLNGSDPEGSALTYAVVASPTHGALSGTAPNLSYRPQTNYFGADSFTFRVNDGSADSVLATVSISVTAVNDPPVAFAGTLNTSKNTAASITLTGSDVEGSALTHTVVGSPTHGSLTGQPPNLTYRPQTNYYGADSFTFKVNDGSVDSGLATVSITVQGTNAVPLAQNQSRTTSEDASVAIVLNGSDADGNPLTYSVVSAPANGLLSGTAPNLTYSPNTNFFGTDSFTFKVNDGLVDSSLATVSITVNSVNDRPIATNQSVTTAEDTTVNVLLSGSDVDGGALTYAIVAQPTHGSLSGTAPNLSYRPQTNYSGPDSFTFRVNDGTTNSSTATVSLTVTPVNDPPVAFAGALNTSRNTAASITLSGSDVEGSALTYAVVSNPTHGSVSGQPPNLTYQANTNYTGSDSFTFKVNDGSLDSALATVLIDVKNGNRRPRAHSSSVTTAEDTAAAITLSAIDDDGDALVYTVVNTPANGVLSGEAPDLIFTPNADYNGQDSLTFEVNDGTENSLAATVTFTVTASNDAPIASTRSLTVNSGAPTNIVLTATDSDGDALTYSVVNPPAHGSLSGQAPNLTYTSQPGFAGSDSFDFVANDGTDNSAITTVSITVVVPVDESLRITRLSVTGSGAWLIWDTVPGKTYRVRYKNSLDAATWTIAAQNLVSSGSQLYWVDSGALSVPQRFYRVELVAP